MGNIFRILIEDTEFYKNITEQRLRYRKIITEREQKRLKKLNRELVDEAISNSDLQLEVNNSKEEEKLIRKQFQNLSGSKKADILFKKINLIEQKQLFEKEQEKKDEQFSGNLQNNYKKRLELLKKLQQYLEKK